MTATTPTTAPALTTEVRIVQTVSTWVEADCDRSDAQKVLDAAKANCTAQIAALEVLLFGQPLTDEQKLTYNAKNKFSIPGTDRFLSYRDYGKCSMSKVLGDLFAWIGSTKTVKVDRIKAEYDRLTKVHFTHALKGNITLK